MDDEHDRSGPVDHASRRWARVTLTVLPEAEDPRTLQRWSRIAGVSVSTLHQISRAAGLAAKASLDFARLARAVHLGQRTTVWELENLLDVADRRTLTRLFQAGGLIDAYLARRAPTMDEFFCAQRLVTGQANLRALRGAIRDPAPGRLDPVATVIAFGRPHPRPPQAQPPTAGRM